jgi:hypothetical protein
MIVSASRSHARKAQLENGHDYYRFHGTTIHLPPKPVWEAMAL